MQYGQITVLDGQNAVEDGQNRKISISVLLKAVGEGVLKDFSYFKNIPKSARAGPWVAIVLAIFRTLVREII